MNKMKTKWKQKIKWIKQKNEKKKKKQNSER